MAIEKYFVLLKWSATHTIGSESRDNLNDIYKKRISQDLN